MTGRRGSWRAVVAAGAVLIASATVAAAESPWAGREQEILEVLRNGEVVREEKVGMGVTDPVRLTLRKDGTTLRAIWKPLPPGRRGGFWESYKAEIAAYELDAMLGLGMVPPTALREISGETGSAQLWVEGAKLYVEVQDDAPSSREWSHELSRMKMFDNLIYNPDRNAQNFMADSDWNVVLIDHSRAFTARKKLLPEDHQRPVQFDRRLVERLRALDDDAIEKRLGDLLSKGERKALSARRQALLLYLQEIVHERGEDRVLF